MRTDTAHADARSRTTQRLRLTIAILLAGLVASLALGAGPAGAGTPVKSRTATERSIQQSVLELVNQQRKAHHLKPVTMNARLTKAARQHNATMAHANVMSHRVRGEASLGRRVDHAGYKWSAVAENIAWNSAMNRAGVLDLQNLMYHERAPYDGHRRNILDRSYREVGVDVYYDTKHDKVWLTTDFGRKR